MVTEIIAVGTEILMGNITNTNAVFLAQKLSESGMDVYYQTAVGDNPMRLKEAVRLALSRSDIIITTGGLGPTKDDLTKETVCELLQVPLAFHNESMERIEEYFRRIHSTPTKSNEKQAYLPEGCTVLPNDNGTAPGFLLRKSEKIVVTLPGPPAEMKLMFTKYVLPELKTISGSTIVSRNVNIIGIGESTIDEDFEVEMNASNPTLAPYAKEGEVRLRVSAKAENEEQALKLITPLVDRLRTKYGDNVYGIDSESIEAETVGRLIAGKKTVAVAESCTGGLISKRITDIPGSSEVFGFGICTYSNTAKMKLLGVKEDTLKSFGAVSPETAAQMADGVRKLADSDIGIATTGIAGPGGGTPKKPVGLVYVGVSDKNGTEVKELFLGGNDNIRSRIRHVSASHAFFMMLQRLKNL